MEVEDVLVVRKGKSSKSYENKFFRKISKELSQVFEQKQWNGILLGMPECVTREDLQIDCLLITENQIIILDFKDYSGILKLPTKENFRIGRWMMDGGVTVKGGSSPNPFCQLAKQRIKLVDELKNRINPFERKTISTVVLFQEKVEIIGEIPREFQAGFSIADPTDYLNKLVDMIDVRVDKDINYLSEINRKLFTEILFTTEDYRFDYHAEVELHEPIMETHTETQHPGILKQIQEFLVSDCRVMTLTGNTGSGKTALIPHIRELAFDAGFTDVPIFAYSNRLRNKMLKNNPGLEDVGSLFRTIFDFNKESIDEFYKKIIPLKEKEEIHDDDKTIYIIDDSHLITNSNLDSDLLRFGSGYLLTDLFNYIDLESNPDRKIIFIGDKHKLSFGAAKENALNLEYLETLLKNRNIYSEVMNIDLPDNEGNSEIIKVCNKIAHQINNNQYNELFIDSKDEITICTEKDWKEVVNEVYQNPKNSKILVFTNEQANQTNGWIKRNIIRNGNDLAEGDYIVFHSTIEALISDNNNTSSFDIKRVDNGYFGEVIRVNYNNMIIKTLDVKEERVVLRFIPCQIKLQDGIIIETLVLDNYLKSTSNELDKKEIIALQILLASYEKDLMNKEPFEKSIEYQEMLQHRDQYTIYQKDGKVEYRDAKDKRKLTSFEKAYRKRIWEKLKFPTSYYFKILNFAKVKYGWAMTVHKAMAYSFDTVVFNTYQDANRGRTNKDYFKWIYTGISIGVNNVKLVKWKPISPFLNTEFNETPNVGINDVLFTLSNGEKTPAEQLLHYLETKLHNKATICNIASRPYLEMVTLEMEGRKIKLLFDYNRRGQMKMPRLGSGAKEDYETFQKLLEPTIPLPTGVMQPFLKNFSSLLEHYHIQMKLIHYSDWNFIFNFSREEKKVEIQLWYNNTGMISRFNYIRGDKELFNNIVHLIKEIYVLD